MVLLELFGKPWRIVEVDKDAPVGEPELDKALEMADAMAGSATARFPRGTKLAVVAPDAKAGDLHNATIADCDLQLSKLVLGVTGTTDAVANRAESQVHAAQQDVLLQTDGARLSERFERNLCASIVVVNFGERERRHAPRFQLRTAPPVDRMVEQQRLRGVLEMGVPIAVATVYEVTGFREPLPDEPVVQFDAGTSIPAGRGRVVDPNEPSAAEDARAASSERSPGTCP